MGWKNWPYWLRGGIIGAGVFLIILVATFSEDQLVWIYFIFGLFLFIPLYAIFGEDFFGNGCFSLEGPGECNFLLLNLFLLLEFFIIGCLFGLLFGKLRNL